MQLSLEKLPVSERIELIQQLWDSIISDSKSLKDIKNIPLTSSQEKLVELLDKRLSVYAENKFYHRFNIENIIGSRGISILCHFTPINNLESILNNGLYPRDYIDENMPDAIWTDDGRFDGMKNGICLSLSFPNHQMFYSKRIQRKDIESWAIIVLDARKVILNYDCAFFQTNSAFGDYRNKSLSEFMTSNAFLSLFQEEVETRNGVVTRQNYLTDEFPTDVQAEIVVFDHIPPDSIEVCYLQSGKDLKYFRENFSKFTFIEDSNDNSAFGKRD
ncbi:DarT ssDNA thymidine ADP-ribosyltransferase family protein [Psychrobacter sp. Pi2-52]|uniref:DarT ssDNA thymidine ADP-ribosyltransferase family protein n=1 Tax=Psychrobacter sp. Pi2-52 TaxID=2774133 RepID=UPI00191A7BCB|nr:DarT ssDNA thymidine ADP-ribosyltransferase family protein [Psychrobacter sp. Pi2-52]